MLSSYYTVKTYGEHEQIIQKSRFIGYVQRVETEEEAQHFIQEIKKKHHGANHNCSAYLIGENDQIQKANDDGEPSGTAGVPILEVLKKRKLKNTVVVITRYFGGIKLGAGGLIRAYGSSTSKVLDATGIVEKVMVKQFSIKIDYTLLGKIQNDIKQTNFILNDITYLDKVDLNIYVRLQDVKDFHNWITNITMDAHELDEKEDLYIEIDVKESS
ncbi:YigZ family protein [Pseudalkalibacillus sp. Hm43]|uniref:YigZ family protein n=1 Tax=Pseudalkalibacillus sp. Hm43 TaxID=3450742 RepID=UPI003F42A694